MTGLIVGLGEVIQNQHFPQGIQFSVFQDRLLEQNDYDNVVGDETDVTFTFETSSSQGSTVKVFFDDWYNRIHISDRVLDFVNLITDQTRTIKIWNAYLDSKSLNSTSFPAVQGVAVDSPVSTPYTLRPLEQLDYVITVTVDGPPTIDALLVWNIQGETDVDTQLLGRRIVVWPFKPDWSQSFVESLEWSTDVITSFNGDEQRIALRSKPRRSFEYSSLVSAENVPLLSNLLWGWQHRNFVVPLWFDRSRLISAATASDTVLSLDTVNRGFSSGGMLLLIDGVTDYEAVEIDSFTSSSVTLARPLERNWSAGVEIYPLNIVRFPTNVTASQMNDSVRRVNIIFSADPVQNDPYIPSVAATVVHEGYEVILKRPNWARAIDVENEFITEQFDNRVGAPVFVNSREYPTIVRRFQWDMYSKDEIREFRELLGRLRGRNRAVYLPTWFSEFELYADEVASAQTIRVKHNGFYNMVGLSSVMNTIMILPVTGSPIIRTIESVGADLSGFVTLGLDAPVGVDLNDSTLSRISLTHLCRMLTDRVTINRLSDSVATVEVDFVVVKA